MPILWFRESYFCYIVEPRAIQPKPAEGVTETSTAPKKETGKKPRKTKKAAKKKETEGAAKQGL